MTISGPAAIWKRTSSGEPVRSFDDAFTAVHSRLESLSAQDAVFAAHLEILDDPMIKDAVAESVASGMDELAALRAARDGIVAMFGQVDDEYLRARADDVRDIFGQIEACMCGVAAGPVELPQGAVLVAEELFPSDVPGIDFSRIAGILCAKGSSTSHVCIMAHSKGVPIQVGADISGIKEGDIVSVDDPMVDGGRAVAAKVRAASRKLYVNAGNLDDIRRGIEAGADGVGLFRTEFLFLERDSMPTREEQARQYKEALLACGGKVLTLRTMDAGGDKDLPYLSLPREDNPFLGLRGVRCSLARPDLLKQQLGAAVDAAREVRALCPQWFAACTPLRLMLPMVCTLEELRAVKDALRELAADYEELLQVGIMIETPAAALDAAALATESAFFSIGSNDLTQYVMAADRGNHYVSHLYDPYSPAVRRAVEFSVKAAHEAGIPVGICGEIASDPRATDYLLGLGLDSLSVSRL